MHTFECQVTTAGGLNIGGMTVKATESVYVKEAVAMGADIVVENDKAYYVIRLKNVGYAVEDYKFFDGSNVYAIADSNFEGETAIIRIDITEIAVGTEISPHLSFAGKNYVNGGNWNGDVLVSEDGYENGKYVTLNGKKYSLFKNWGMPALKVEAAPVVEEHTHELSEVAKVEPGCETTGTEAYYTCSGCDKHFSDAEGTTEIPAPVTIDATGHNWSTELKEGVDGFYYECLNGCGETQSAEVPSVEGYQATLNNEFVSTKENELVLTYAKYGAYGITTNGSYKQETGAPAGAIGGLDAAGKYVKYEFVMDKAGTVDFIWSIAGSWYNGTNAGLTDMGAHMSVTIDGKAVDVAGIALPAGEGDYLWWNLQKVVVKDVILEAGVHTLECQVTTAGGLNVGDLTIKSTKAVNAREAVATGADIVLEGDKVYYVFTFRNVGYTVEDYKFFNGDATYEIAASTFEGNTAIIKIDVTALEVGTTIDPHLKLAGKNYVNDANVNGDLRGDSIVYQNGKVVGLNDKYYQLYTNWSMPSLKVITKACQAVAADIVVEGDKVYYTFTFENIGYNPAEYEFFDGQTIYAVSSYKENGTKVTFKLDVTEVAAGTQIYPHVRINGEMPTHKSGDLLVDASGYENNKSVTLGDKTYTLVKSYGMPTLKVAVVTA